MTKTNANNNWLQRYGAKRRAIDRAILAELEQTIAAEERAADEMRKAIARAFGRPPERLQQDVSSPHKGNDRQGNDRRYGP